MKKLFLLAVLALVSISASAQIESGIRFGVNANATISSVLGDKVDGKSIIGYSAAFMLDYNFSEKFHLETGLGLVNKGVKDMLGGYIEGEFKGTYLTLPLHIGYRLGIGSNLYLNLQVGPEFAYGIFGSEIEWQDGSDNTGYFDEGWAERFEVGIGGKLGVEFSNIQINFGVNYGLTEYAKDTDWHTMVYSIGVGYMF